MVYVTSDLHFFHRNIIKHCERPFDSIEDMNETLILLWNDTVNCDDEVYILGDVTLKGQDIARQYLRMLNGTKYLIRGNHDKFAVDSDWLVNEGLVGWVKDYYEMSYLNEFIVMCHYPFAEWNRKRKGSFCLHGHLHSKKEYNIMQKKQGIRRFDVGVDANDYSPVSIDDILKFHYL